MDNIFFGLFIVSFIALVIGLIRPSTLSRITRRTMRRKSVGLIFGGATFVSMILFGMTTDAAKNVNTNKNTENTNESTAISNANVNAVIPVQATTYSNITIKDITVANNQVTINGTTDLPDGAKFATSFDVWGRSDTATWIGSEGDARVSKGGFISTLPIPQRDEFVKGPYEICVFFTPVGENEQISDLVGNKGEKLTGDLVTKSEYGWNIMELCEKKELTISVSPIQYHFVFQTPSQFSKQSAEYALAQFATSWKGRDWKGMTTWVAKDWVSRNNDSAILLSNMLNIKYLESFTITDVNKRSDVLATITFEVQYRPWSPDSINVTKVQISADIRKENDSGTPDSNGTWGVYPNYSEQEIK